MKKKVVKLNENDITRIVKKTILKENDTYKFRSDFSDNLRRIERTTSNGDVDLLDDIVDVYQTHIKYIQDYLKDIADKEKERESDNDE
jgi:hypothetical protein